MKIVLGILIPLQLLPGIAIAQQPECDPHYSGACVPVYRTEADDVDCSDIEEKNFTVVTIGEDPHRLDGDEDGVTCEAKR
ncbi:MAG: calcium-binding protein with excalibur domain protein [Cyanobacteria bacterium J06634_6]